MYCKYYHCLSNLIDYSYIGELLPVRRKTYENQSTNQSIKQSNEIVTWKNNKFYYIANK